MKTLSTLVGTFGALALLFAPNSTAQCGGVRQPLPTHANWQSQFGQARIVRAALAKSDDFDEEPSIVGFWRVKFISDGISSGLSPAPPKGAPVDAGYSEWHSDGTEIMNSGGHAPSTSSFCLGVWEKTALRKYALNHFAIAWDPTKVTAETPQGVIVGPVSIRENVTLAENGESFTGRFTINQYDESDHLLFHLQGSITATRIAVNTQPSSVF